MATNFIPVLCTGTMSAGIYLGRLSLPHTNAACYLGNWNEFAGTGEVLRIGSMYMASHFSCTNDNNRPALYMTQDTGLLS